jgi:hypothetical protein
MRQQVDTDADGADFRRRLKDAAGNFGRMQRQPEREAADAATDDKNVVHVSSPAVQRAVKPMKHD